MVQNGLFSRLALGSRVEPDELRDLEEGEWRSTSRPQESHLAVVRAADVWPVAFHVIGDADAVASLWQVLLVEDDPAIAGSLSESLRRPAARTSVVFPFCPNGGPKRGSR